jgi:hypothetical protein
MPSTAQTQLDRVTVRFVPPLIAFFIHRGIAVAAAYSQGLDPWAAATWARWDSDHYMDIADRGYELISCAEAGYPAARGSWCGNTGWFPGYPALILLAYHAGGWVIGTPLDIAVALSAVCFLALLTLIWSEILKQKIDLRSLLLLGIAAVFPGSIYFAAVFPISLVAFFLLWQMHLARSDRMTMAALAGLAAGFCYPTGFVAVVGYELESLRLWINGDRLRALRLAFVGISGCVGFGFALLVQWAQTGAWDAFFKVQAKYGYLQAPFYSLIEACQRWPSPPSLQTLGLGSIMLILIGSSLAHGNPRVEASRLPILVSTGYWLFPHVLGGANSLYRSESLLITGLEAWSQLPCWALMLLLAALCWLAYQMDLLFFTGVLV